MPKPTSSRRWASLEVPAADFQYRINQLAESPSVSVLSRLALIHQVAKAYATEALHLAGTSPQAIAIEEITDPPMYNVDIIEGVVIVQYSYEEFV